MDLVAAAGALPDGIGLGVRVLAHTSRGLRDALDGVWRAAREVLTKGERKGFVVQALDPPRRGIELALPEFAKISGAPTEETVEAEIEDDESIRKAAAR